jgi:outer membrane protein OmpA-like peptidoglycan-associated protein
VLEVFFPPGSDNLPSTTNGWGTVDKWAGVNCGAVTRLKVFGFSDASGGDEFNWSLACQRAKNIAQRLAKDCRVSAPAFNSLGKLHPTGNSNYDRRVEIRLP